ncbi:MAG: hypothetical protein ACR2LJ_11830 [Acidimicrobiales bacterium]
MASTLRSARAAPLAAALIVVVHLCYGSGVLRGLSGLRRVPAPSPAKAFDVEIGGENRAGTRVSYGAVLSVLVERQARVRMKRAWFGLVWPVVAPLVLLALDAFVFRSVFQVPVRNYPIFLFSGLLPWTFLAQRMPPPDLDDHVAELVAVARDLQRRRPVYLDMLMADALRPALGYRRYGLIPSWPGSTTTGASSTSWRPRYGWRWGVNPRDAWLSVCSASSSGPRPAADHRAERP